MLGAARELFREADDAVRRARPTERARRHHEHLARAAADLAVALKEAEAAA